MFRGLLHRRGHLTGHEVLHLFRYVVPGVVVVERVQVSHAFSVALLPLLLHLVLQLLEVPLRRLVLGEVGDELGDGHGVLLLLGPFPAFRCFRELTGHEAASRQGHVGVPGDDAVDCQVRGHVPHLGRCLATFRQVAEDEVVELVGQDATDLLVRHFAEELRVPVQRDVVVLGVEGHRRRGHGVRRRLPDVPGQLSEERRVLEEGDEVAIQVEVGLDGVQHRHIIPRWRLFCTESQKYFCLSLAGVLPPHGPDRSCRNRHGILSRSFRVWRWD